MVQQQALLSVRNLGVRFQSQRVLRNISFDVPRGQTLAIIGESGCGKTVLLKTLIGLIRPTSGEVLFDGQSIDTLGEQQLTALRARYGFVFQNAALFDSLTIFENIAFPLRQHRRIEEIRIQELIEQRIAEVGLPVQVLDKKPAELSGGMRKRVGLARALIMNPEILLYDEPTTGLDPIVSDVINELMMRTRTQHSVTSIIVTHDMKTARKVADRIIMLYPLLRLEDDEDQVLFQGTPAAIDDCPDRRVTQFVKGEAGERLMEMREQRGA